MISGVEMAGGAASQAALRMSGMAPKKGLLTRQEMSNNSARAPTLLDREY